MEPAPPLREDGFYTGTKREWQNVPMIKAEASGD